VDVLYLVLAYISPRFIIFLNQFKTIKIVSIGLL
jgi:hypothetical protein